ncbi:STAS domain-containing protein [Paraconexibacter antarcticus]|uniref:STAS domain-containing protein n=1 Tax=Paraconexibacter antarcticus TaxID=2949664 RepID=A0ABY5DUJ9_9ACTN|nr:STAS domain-containing protein [Paraconexibacter antarcticus]UTI64377.1 STAS domain-containing protein [Paraconexibacter antarcticus]
MPRTPARNTAATPTLRVTTEQTPTARVIGVHGELVVATVAQLQPELDRITRQERRQIIIDLRTLTRIDSSGARAIEQLYHRCGLLKQTLSIRPGPARVQQVFEFCRLAAVLPFAEEP